MELVDDVAVEVVGDFRQTPAAPAADEQRTDSHSVLFRLFLHPRESLIRLIYSKSLLGIVTMRICEDESKIGFVVVVVVFVVVVVVVVVFVVVVVVFVVVVFVAC